MIEEYVKGKPYFCDVCDKIKSYPYLDKNVSCDCLVVGGGIDGAITAYYLTKSGIECLLIDKNRLGFMNTCCATALLEYQLDEHARDLKKFFSRDDVVGVYKLGLNAINDIDPIINELGNFCHYSKRDTLIFSTKNKDKKEILEEYNFRKDYGFDVKYIDEENNPFPFLVKSALLSKNGGAEFNPYLFEKQLIDFLDSKIGIYENTEAKEIIETYYGFKVITNYGKEIKCKYLVCSTGYNSHIFTKKRLCEKFVSYTIVSKPLSHNLWDRTLLQDNSQPYHYLRLSPDNRLIIGGEDIPLKKGIKEKDAEKYYDMLYDYATQMFPDENFEIDYKFCGVFSTTKNNLSIIGRDRQKPNLFYNLGYGANGIVYSIFGGQQIASLIKNEPTSPYLKFFSPERKLP